jgi:hypothetical protein
MKPHLETLARWIISAIHKFLQEQVTDEYRKASIEILTFVIERLPSRASVIQFACAMDAAWAVPIILAAEKSSPSAITAFALYSAYHNSWWTMGILERIPGFNWNMPVDIKAVEIVLKTSLGQSGAASLRAAVQYVAFQCQSQDYLNHLQGTTS